MTAREPLQCPSAGPSLREWPYSYCQACKHLLQPAYALQYNKLALVKSLKRPKESSFRISKESALKMLEIKPPTDYAVATRFKIHYPERMNPSCWRCGLIILGPALRSLRSTKPARPISCQGDLKGGPTRATQSLWELVYQTYKTRAPCQKTYDFVF